VDEPEKDPKADSTPAKPADKKPVEVKINLEDIHKRARQVTRSESPAGNYTVSPDSRNIYFVMSNLGRPDLWRISAEGGIPSRITQSGEFAGQLQFVPDGSKLIYVSAGSIRSITPGSPSPTPAPIAINATMTIDARATSLQMFDEAWRKMRDGFYDEKMHGVDWNRIRETYRPVVEDITYKEDFYSLFNLVLGELNASHTGIEGPTEGDRGLTTASIGVEFDDSFAGPGVRVKSVMRKGPADEEGRKLQPGDVILKVDGESVGVNESVYTLLGGKVGKWVELKVTRGDSEKAVRLKPIPLASYKNLEYDQWVKEREEATEKLSNGRLGYLHLSQMNDTNLEKFKRAVFGDMQAKNGLVLDVRFNGGGSIADEIFAVLQQRVFSYRTIRGDPNKLTAPLQAWVKPTIVLINEFSFSNAEVFPWGFRELGLGKVVGMPTFGAVIGTGRTTLIDGTTLRMPGAGSYTLKGINMENNGCPPDILVEHTLEDIHSGKDRQLERAVLELARDLPKQRPADDGG
jgi:C-terminal processing protease CtpA/Prc